MVTEGLIAVTGEMSAIDAVIGVLETYFDGLYHADSDRLAEAVHPQAIHATADVTPLLYRAIVEYIQVLEKRESPASRKEIRHDVIDAI